MVVFWRDKRGNTYAQLDGNREEVASSLLGNLLTTWYTRQVDVAGLNETLCACNSLEQLLGEPAIKSALSHQLFH